MMNPLLTRYTLSPAVAPEIVNAGVAVDVEYTYIPLFTVMIMSVLPATYPGKADTFEVVCVVLAEYV
jgi:hypothetical protein